MENIYRGLTSLILVTIALCNQQPKVELSDGSVILGFTTNVRYDYLNLDAKVDKYLGIPYAEPPVGSLRFRPPVRKGPLDSQLNATKVGNACMQHKFEEISTLELEAEEFSEDCLYLDVLVPNPLPDDCNVLVNIHGGGFVMGSGSFKLISILPNVVLGNYIVVSMNYRLNVFGFLTTGDDVVPGNVGLQDQQMSLQWVQDNIAAFGGNPNKVTIIGVSAGGASVGFHLLSPGSEGLFRHAIMESGSPIDTWCAQNTPEESLKTARLIARLAGCSEEETAESENLVSCLQGLPADDILSNEAKLVEHMKPKGISFFPPSVDGMFISKHPRDLLEEGTINSAEVIVGTNNDESTMTFLGMFPEDADTPFVNRSTLQRVYAMFGGVTEPVIADTIATLYAEDERILSQKDSSLWQPAKDFITDHIMFCTQNEFADGLVSAGSVVYRFIYTHVSSRDMFHMASWLGAAHGDEMEFTFGSSLETENQERFTDEDRGMAVQVLKYWTNFIETGNPNTEETDSSSYPSWPKYTIERKEYKELSVDMSNNKYPHERRCHFVQKVLPQLKAISAELNQLKEKEEIETKKWTSEGQCEEPDCH